jgi:DDE superfamily endonuclease
MASRLYRTTRPLFVQVALALEALQVPPAVGGNPTTFGLVALYVAGLVLLDARPTQRRISAALPARAHDALNRLLRATPLSPRALLRGLLGFVRGLSRRRGTPGYLCVDDVVIEKPFAKRLPWASWTYSFSKKRKVYGVHVVLLLWSSDPAGTWRVPVAFRLWRPKRTAVPGRYQGRYQKKTQLVGTLLREVVAAGCPAAYLVGDTSYTGGGVRAAAERLGLVWVGTLAPRTTVVWRRRRQPVQALAATLTLKWRPRLGGRAAALSVYAPSLGQVRVVVLKNAHGNHEYLVTNERDADLTRLVQRKRSRWRIETICRDTKQLVGLAAGQCWMDQAFVRHVALVFLTFVVLQLLRRDPRDTAGAVKARWQGEVLRDGQAPPPPLRAAPPAFRIK